MSLLFTIHTTIASNIIEESRFDNFKEYLKEKSKNKIISLNQYIHKLKKLYTRN